MVVNVFIHSVYGSEIRNLFIRIIIIIIMEGTELL